MRGACPDVSSGLSSFASGLTEIFIESFLVPIAIGSFSISQSSPFTTGLGQRHSLESLGSGREVRPLVGGGVYIILIFAFPRSQAPATRAFLPHITGVSIYILTTINIRGFYYIPGFILSPRNLPGTMASIT